MTGVTEKLNFIFDFIVINLNVNVNSHTWPHVSSGKQTPRLISLVFR